MGIISKYQISSKIIVLVKLIGALCFICMPLNILFYLGFYLNLSASENIGPNPFGLTIEFIYLLHGGVGFLFAVFFDVKQWFLSGLIGLFSALSITVISYYYFGWRELIEFFEILLPLIFGIVPFKITYDYLLRKKSERKV
jgi:hypothetical protein